jgi:hypothetical protein
VVGVGEIHDSAKGRFVRSPEGRVDIHVSPVCMILSGMQHPFRGKFQDEMQNLSLEYELVGPVQNRIKSACLELERQ